MIYIMAIAPIISIVFVIHFVVIDVALTGGLFPPPQREPKQFGHFYPEGDCDPQGKVKEKDSPHGSLVE
jgi:hypothetical protein